MDAPGHGAESSHGVAEDSHIPLLDIDQTGGEQRRASWTISAAMVGVVALVAAGVAIANLGGSGDAAADGGATAIERSELDGPGVVELGPAGPRDGLESKGHPVWVDQPDGLIDGQTVVVSGSDFPPHTALGVVMCSGAVELGGGSAQCQLSPYTPVQSRVDGTFEVEFPVRRIIQIGGHEIDCGAEPPHGLESTCAIAVGAISDYDESGTARIWFDSAVPPPPPPEMTVSPTDGLVDGHVITVTVTGIDSEWYWWPSLCAHVDPANAHPDAEAEYWCEPLAGDDGMGQTGGAANGSVEVPVHRLFGAMYGSPTIVDCAEAPGRCWIEVWAGPRPIPPVPLAFDPSAPVPEPPPPYEDTFPTDTTIVP